MSVMFASRTICPLCLEQFPPGQIAIDYPFCPDCSSEGIDFDVEPFEAFMSSKTSADFEDMLARWNALAGQFRPEYHALKAHRISELHAMKATAK